MTLRHLGLVALVAAAVGLGVGLGRLVAPQPETRASATDEARVLRELEKLKAQVQRLNASGSAAVVVHAEPTPAVPPRPIEAAPTDVVPNEDESADAPTPAQVEAGDRLVALADRIIQSGRLTPEDSRALREAAGEADAERRDETLLALVRSVNSQRVKPTQPGPLF